MKMVSVVLATLGVWQFAGPVITDAIRDRLSDPVSISTEWPDQFGENYSWALRNSVDIPGSNMSPPSNFFRVSPRQFNAVKVEEQGIKITVVGGHSKPVIITNLKARISGTAPLVSGTLLCAIPQGNSPLLRVGIDLNDLNPSARSINERGQLTDRYFESNSITLNRGETQSISVDVRASRKTFTWDLHYQMVSIHDAACRQDMDDLSKQVDVAFMSDDGRLHQAGELGGLLAGSGSPEAVSSDIVSALENPLGKIGDSLTAASGTVSLVFKNARLSGIYLYCENVSPCRPF